MTENVISALESHCPLKPFSNSSSFSAPTSTKLGNPGPGQNFGDWVHRLVRSFMQFVQQILVWTYQAILCVCVCVVLFWFSFLFFFFLTDTCSSPKSGKNLGGWKLNISIKELPPSFPGESHVQLAARTAVPYLASQILMCLKMTQESLSTCRLGLSRSGHRKGVLRFRSSDRLPGEAHDAHARTTLWWQG